MFTVMASLSAMVAVAADAPLFGVTCDDTVDVIVPKVTVKDSAVSDSMSSVAVMVMVCVAPAALPAANVTVPEVADRSEPSAASVLSGADQATVTSFATSADRVMVKEASLPSATLDAGPEMDISALSSSSVRVTVAEVTLRPVTVVVPGMLMVSSPSTTVVVRGGDLQRAGRRWWSWRGW